MINQKKAPSAGTEGAGASRKTVDKDIILCKDNLSIKKEAPL
jgi:hypothetical protein